MSENNLIADLDRQKYLTLVLKKASREYYVYDKAIMSDKKYDELYDELMSLEEKSGIVFNGSPTNKVQGEILKGFEKQKHSKPMLSAKKTKNPKEISIFLKNNDYYTSYKMDGLTLVVIYENGIFKTALTRGSGDEGEIVTENAKFIVNMPQKISYKGRLELRGECVVSWDTFNYNNSHLREQFSHPRNMAAGSLRNFDTEITKLRMLEYIVFECITDLGIDDKTELLDKVEEFGFTTVQRWEETFDDYSDILERKPINYPVDGLIFEIKSRKISESLGATDKYENSRIALKWEDETYETVFQDIEWNTTRTGVINPVAVFNPVEIQGSIVTRATLHNLSYIKELQLGKGDLIQVYKSNMIIPKIHDNITRSNTWTYPEKCPCCGHPTVVKKENKSEMLYCVNDNCNAKLISKLTHFVDKDGMNINGLSESTLETFISKGLIGSYIDIYHLDQYKNKICNMNGFGLRSASKLLDSIEASRTVDLEHFITALGINLIGKATAKDISKFYNGKADAFIEYMLQGDINKLRRVEGIGDAAIIQLKKYFDENKDIVLELIKELRFEDNAKKKNSKDDMSNNAGSDILKDMVFVVTGSVNHFKNRSELQKDIELHGGKVTGSVSTKTSVLINNDINGKSSKNVKAKELKIPIWSEEDYLNFVKNKN